MADRVVGAVLGMEKQDEQREIAERCEVEVKALRFVLRQVVTNFFGRR